MRFVGLFVLGLVACDSGGDDQCDTVIEVHVSAEGDECGMGGLTDCCPSGFEWLGNTRDGDAVCFLPECRTAFSVAVGTDGSACELDGACCPHGYSVVGYDPAGDPICLED